MMYGTNNKIGSASDAQAEIARLTAAIERTEANRNDILADLDGVTAERDAIAAAAFEAAAKQVDKYSGVSAVSPIISALTPADAKAALDRMLRQAKADGMRMAAEIVAGIPSWTIEKFPFGRGEATLTEPTDPLSCAVAILARAKDMEAGNG